MSKEGTAPMAEHKSGPVKPPVIDLKPRESAADPAQEDARSGAGEGARPTPPRPPARLAMPWSAISIAALGGAILGTALTYALVNLLPLPDNRPVIADPAPALAALGTDVAALGARLDALSADLAADAGALEAARTALSGEIAGLRDALAALPEPVELPELPEPVDLTPIEAQLATLEDRISAIGAGASSADAAALAGSLSTLDQRLAALGTRLDGLESGVATGSDLETALRAEIESLRADLAAQASSIEQAPGGATLLPAVRLPLLVAGLDGAFAAGRPYTDLLNRLTTLLPDLAVPSPVLAAADAGLPRADTVALRFRQAVPDILANRAATSSGDLGQDALEWLKGILALRPVIEIEGDTPEAIVSRLEAAVERHDFAAAASLLAALPEPMREAAGTRGTDITLLAEAEIFIERARARALGGLVEATP